MWDGKAEISDLLSRPLSRHVCGEWHSSRHNLWSHILTDHLHIHKSEDGQSFSNKESGSYVCRWSGCVRPTEPMTSPRDIGLHVRLHIPESPTESESNKSDVLREPEFTRHTFYSTPADEKNMPSGIGWTSIMVTQNLARYASRQQFQA